MFKKVPVSAAPAQPYIIEYPKWKNLIPDMPTKEQIIQSFRIIFKCEPSEARIFFKDDDIQVFTTSVYHIHGGFGYHTENPILKNRKDIYYTGCGCTWGVDDDGIRYYKIDKDSNLPYRWREIYAQEILIKYKELIQSGSILEISI